MKTEVATQFIERCFSDWCEPISSLPLSVISLFTHLGRIIGDCRNVVSRAERRRFSRGCWHAVGSPPVLENKSSSEHRKYLSVLAACDTARLV